jgi:RNA-binding protein YhbY
VLGEAVEIPQAGLSIRLPSGNGWNCDNNWEHREDELLLSSYLRPSSDTKLADIVCRYRLASFRKSSRQWLEQYAEQYDTINPEYGTQQIEGGATEWVYIKQTHDKTGVLAATIQLDQGRWLDIEITQTGITEEIAPEVFEKITKHIVIKENKLLGKGIEVVNNLKVAGLDKVISQKDEPSYYLVKDSGKNNVGFVVEIFLKSANTEETEISAAAFGYIISPTNRWEKAMFFKSDSGLDGFVWESETDQERTIEMKTGPLTLRGPRQRVRTSTRIVAADSNEVLINKLGPDFGEAGHLEPREVTVEIGKAAIPEAVLETLYTQMAVDNVDKAMVDVISDDGQVEPVVISISKIQDSKSPVSYTVKIEYLGSTDTEEIDLDSKIQVVKKIIRHNGILVLEPTSLEDLLQRFPERADDILQRSRTIKQGRL